MRFIHPMSTEKKEYEGGYTIQLYDFSHSITLVENGKEMDVLLRVLHGKVGQVAGSILCYNNKGKLLNIRRSDVVCIRTIFGDLLWANEEYMHLIPEYDMWTSN